MSNVIIDVSKHNGTIDWSKVKGNIEAVVIRLGYRGYSTGTIAYDARYRTNRKECEENGIPFSLYFFPCSVYDREAEEEADFIIKEARGMNFVLPVFLDSEVADAKKGSGRADKLSKAERTRYLRIICDKLQAAGIPAGIYASTSWLNSNLDMAQLPYSVWVAQWGNKLTYEKNCILWQYDDAGTVPGITGRVDLSRRVEKDVISPEIPATASAKQRTVTANVLNVRKAPSASSEDIGDLVKGSVITVGRTENGWAHFEGWASEKYLK